jgi:hypothetical protein
MALTIAARCIVSLTTTVFLSTAANFGLPHPSPGLAYHLPAAISGGPHGEKLE